MQSNLTLSSRFSGPQNSKDSHKVSNPFKPPIYNSLTSSHGPMGEGVHRQNSINLHQNRQLEMGRYLSQKENSSIASNSCPQPSRKSCPSTQSGVLSAGSQGRYSCMSGDSQDNSSRSSSNNYKADRFIPFRGTQENFFEEFMMNNDPFHESKKRSRKSAMEVGAS